MSTKMLHDPPSKPERSFEIVARRIAAMIQASYRIGQRLPAEDRIVRRHGDRSPAAGESSRRNVHLHRCLLPVAPEETLDEFRQGRNRRPGLSAG